LPGGALTGLVVLTESCAARKANPSRSPAALRTVGYLRLETFYEGLDGSFRAALQEFRTQGFSALATQR
jgi:C-terminal processing protease CtpA/Prc